MSLVLTRYYAVSESFVNGEQEAPKRAIYVTTSGAVYTLPTEIWKMLEEGNHEAIPEELKQGLMEAGILVQDDEDELTKILEENRSAISNTKSHYMVLQPTASCQLGCGYCGQVHFTRLLMQDHQEKVVKRLEKQYEAQPFGELQVCWFGAEPLSGLPVIRSLSPRLAQFAANHNIPYRARIVTNGYALTPEVAAELEHQHSVYFIEVTLDGPREVHDVRRHLKAGPGSFDRIVSNLEKIAERGDIEVAIRIRCNVDRRNASYVVPLLEDLAGRGLSKRVSFYTAPIHSWGNDAHDLALPDAEYAELEIQWLAEAMGRGFDVQLLPTRKEITCLAVRKTGELIDATGALFNCSEVSYVPAYGTPNRYSIGHVETGEITGRRNLLADFNDRVERREYTCAHCKMLPVCGGGCPELWKEGITPCPSPKHNIEDRLLLYMAQLKLSETPPG